MATRGEDEELALDLPAPMHEAGLHGEALNVLDRTPERFAARVDAGRQRSATPPRAAVSVGRRAPRCARADGA